MSDNELNRIAVGQGIYVVLFEAIHQLLPPTEACHLDLQIPTLY